jgi:hypothetical protein
MRRCVNELGFVGTLVVGTCGGLFLEQSDLTDDERSAIAYRNAETVMRI